MEPYMFFIVGALTMLACIIVCSLLKVSSESDTYEVPEQIPPKGQVVITDVEDHNIMVGDDFYLADGGILHVTDIKTKEDNIILEGFYYANSH